MTIYLNIIMKKITNEEIISRAIAVHGDTYDYSHMTYVNSRTKIKIMCKIHGEFNYKIAEHISNKRGCPYCSNTNTKKDLKSFLEKAKLVHGNKYDYSNANYVNSKSKIKIICKIHGIFEQSPTLHISGSGCPLCNGKFKLSNEEFIIRANHVHSNKYDYSLVNYINSNTKIKIICKTHGIFEQTPISHINKKNGCAKCYGNTLKTTKEFIELVSSLHNNEYDYSQVNYINSQIKVKIICKKHGEFEQKPNDHQQGYGCPTCSKERTDSHGVFLIKEYLKNNNLKYETEKTFEGCRHKSLLRFDFCVYLNSIQYIIEFDGIQHFKPKKQWGGSEALTMTKKLDKIKDDYCKTFNLPLLRIRYTQVNKIDILLNNFLKDIQ